MPKRTFQPKKAYRKKKQGWRVRRRSPGGRTVLKRRAAKGRKKLANK
jgi:large subunit ribosomal protein L34